MWNREGNGMKGRKKECILKRKDRRKENLYNVVRTRTYETIAIKMLVIEGVEWDGERAANAIVEKLKVKVEFAGLCRRPESCVCRVLGAAQGYISLGRRKYRMIPGADPREPEGGRWDGTREQKFRGS